MPEPDRPWWQRGPALPLLLSLVVHGLLGLLLWAVPWRKDQHVSRVIDTRIVVDVGVLSLAPDAEPRSTVPSSKPGDSEAASESPSSFSVHLLDPPPVSSQVALTAPTVVAPSTPARPEIGTPAGPRSNGTESPGPPGSGGNGGARLFPDIPESQSVVYVIDRSLSMGPNRAWDRARQALLACLGRLRPTAVFQVIPYNRQAEPLRINGRTDLLLAEPATLMKVELALRELQPAGGTDHVQALRRGLALRTDLLYFVTDADELSLDNINAITRFNQGRTAVNVIALNSSSNTRVGSPLRLLAGQNGGTFRQVVQR